jgi:hypothetical protein
MTSFFISLTYWFWVLSNPPATHPSSILDTLTPTIPVVNTETKQSG